MRRWYGRFNSDIEHFLIIILVLSPPYGFRLLNLKFKRKFNKAIENPTSLMPLFPAKTLWSASICLCGYSDRSFDIRGNSFNPTGPSELSLNDSPSMKYVVNQR